MAKNTKKAKISKTDIAATVTEASEAVAVMAIEELGADLPPAEEIELMANETTDIDELAAIVADAEIPDDAVIARLEAMDEQTSEVQVHQAPAAAEQSAAAEFDAMMAAIDKTEVDLAVTAVAHALDERIAYEAVNGHPNIQKTLAAVRRELIQERAARAMLVTGFSETEINRQIHSGKRFNVYALGKLADALRGLSGGAVTNAINNACMRTLFKFRAAGVPFTFETAKAAASDKIRVDAAIKNLLVRHSVSAGTAPTQASSTMQAMVSLGLVNATGGKNPTYTLTNHPAVAKLEEVLMKAA